MGDILLCGLEAQADDAVSRITRVIEVRDKMIAALHRAKARGVVLQIAEDLIGYPMITPARAAEMHKVTFPPANNAIMRLVDMGFLVEITGRSYGRVFVCREILEALE